MCPTRVIDVIKPGSPDIQGDQRRVGTLPLSSQAFGEMKEPVGSMQCLFCFTGATSSE
jgi:hypothetical protein